MSDRSPDRLLAYDSGPKGHRQDVYGADQFDSMAGVRLDELVLTDVDTVHLEHLSHGSAYLGLYGPDGRTVQFNVAASTDGDLHVSLAWTDFEDAAPTVDGWWYCQTRYAVIADVECVEDDCPGPHRAVAKVGPWIGPDDD